MALAVVKGAQLKCAVGTAPAALKVSSQDIVTIEGKAVATIQDCMPKSNVPPFGTCQTLTAAAMGVAQPCNMIPAGPWTPGSTIRTVLNLPVLTKNCKLMCGVGGVITITNPGQTLDDTA